MHVTSKVTRALGSLVALLGLLALPAAGQTSGKIEGRVTDAATGQPLVGAQVIVVGTGLGNVTNQEGFYFINNVPAGVHNIQAQYIGYQQLTVQETRVLVGQTHTVNFPLQTQAVALEAITVQGESNPLVPRDKTVSKAIITGDVVNDLPVDNVQQVLTLQPGVVDSDDAGPNGLDRGLVIRGGRPGEASVYVDGVLVRSFNNGGQGQLDVGTNSLEEVNILLGGFGAEYGSAQSGVINYVTKTGGVDYSGAFNFSTDQILPNDMRYGWTRAEASIGGPLFIENASFHIGLTAEGKEDANPKFRDIVVADSIPVQNVFFRPTGLATYMNADGTPLLDSSGNPQQYVEYEQFTDLGNRQPYSNQDDYALTGTMRFSPLANTRVSVSAIQSRSQGAGFNSAWQFRPKGLPIFMNKSNLFRVGIDQILFQSAESQATLKLNLAYGTDAQKLGQRADTLTLDPDDADFMGFKFSDHEFFYDGVLTYEKYIARIDSINRGLADAPLTLTSALGIDPSEGERVYGPDGGAENPYGVLGYHNDRGFSGHFEAEEKTWTIDADVDWQANRTHRIGAGVELYRKEVTNMTVGQVSTFFHNVYRVEPNLGAVWVKDRMDIGEMVLDIGVRYDFFDSNANYPVIPGLVLPFSPDPGAEAEQCGSPVNDEGLCRPKFVEQERISTFSPRLGVAFPISDATNFRLSYGHFFQLPAFNNLFSAINTDLARSNTNTQFGRPINALKAVQFEAGLSHLFNASTVMDLTAYNKDKLSDVSYRIDLVNWPISRAGPQDGRLLTNLDFGNVKGMDLRLTRRLADYFTMIGGYTLTFSKGTGSDPLSYINSFGRFVDPTTGAPLSPAQALQYSDMDQRHKFVISTTANFDRDVAAGTFWNAILRNTNIGVTAQAASGLPWTRSTTPSALGRGPTGGKFDELINSSRLPWSFLSDARVTRGFEMGSNSLAAFVDVRNVLNTKNTLNVYGFTGSEDPGDIVAEVGGGSNDIILEDLADPVERLSRQRMQQIVNLYGLGDGDDAVLTNQEQKYATTLDYIAKERVDLLFNQPRVIRLGIEWVF